ncbi:MAG: hypothetical protein OEY86_00820 [Nitrospira sp.]|nr:hypothetical protein [Nitrospira sp.]
MSSYGIGQGLAQAGQTVLGATMQMGQMKQRQDYIDAYKKRQSLSAFAGAEGWDPHVLMNYYQPEGPQPMQAQRLGMEVPQLTANVPTAQPSPHGGIRAYSPGGGQFRTDGHTAPKPNMQMERMGMGSPNLAPRVGMSAPRMMNTDKIMKEFPSPGRFLAR